MLPHSPQSSLGRAPAPSYQSHDSATEAKKKKIAKGVTTQLVYFSSVSSFLSFLLTSPPPPPPAMRSTVALLALAASGAVASPLLAKRDAASWAGTPVSEPFPPPSPTLHTAYFPDEAEVGYEQTTATGIEPNMLQTAVAAPSHMAIYPIVVPAPAVTGQVHFSGKGTKGKKEHEAKTTTPEFSAARHWGSLSPVYSVDSGVYGLEGASAKVPDGCSVVQAHIYVSFIWYSKFMKVALV